MNKRPNGKTLPVGGRDYNLLDLLLTRTYVRKVVKLPGGRQVLTPPILICTVRQNIKRYWHLIDDERIRPYERGSVECVHRAADEVKNQNSPLRHLVVGPHWLSGDGLFALKDGSARVSNAESGGSAGMAVLHFVLHYEMQ